MLVLTGTPQSTQWFQRHGQTGVSSARGSQGGWDWSSCPARRGWGMGVTLGRGGCMGGWQQPPPPPVPVGMWSGTWNVLAEILQRVFFGLWTKVTTKEFILSCHFPNSFFSENNKVIFIWKNLLEKETRRKGVNSPLECKGAAVYIWVICHSRQFLRTTVWLHDYKRYQVRAGFIDCARNRSTDMICNLSGPYFSRKWVPLFASGAFRANHICCSHSKTCSRCNARCSRSTLLRAGLLHW